MPDTLTFGSTQNTRWSFLSQVHPSSSALMVMSRNPSKTPMGCRLPCYENHLPSLAHSGEMHLRKESYKNLIHGRGLVGCKLDRAKIGLSSPNYLSTPHFEPGIGHWPHNKQVHLLQHSPTPPHSAPVPLSVNPDLCQSRSLVPFLTLESRPRRADDTAVTSIFCSHSPPRRCIPLASKPRNFHPKAGMCKGEPYFSGQLKPPHQATEV